MTDNSVSRRKRLLELLAIAKSHGIALTTELASIDQDPGILDRVSPARLAKFEITVAKMLFADNPHLALAQVQGDERLLLPIITLAGIGVLVIMAVAGNGAHSHAFSVDIADDAAFNLWVLPFGAALGMLGAILQILKDIGSAKKAATVPRSVINLAWGKLLFGVLTGALFAYLLSSIALKGFLQFNSGTDADLGSITGYGAPLVPVLAGYSSEFLPKLLDLAGKAFGKG